MGMNCALLMEYTVIANAHGCIVDLNDVRFAQRTRGHSAEPFDDAELVVLVQTGQTGHTIALFVRAQADNAAAKFSEF